MAEILVRNMGRRDGRGVIHERRPLGPHDLGRWVAAERPVVEAGGGLAGELVVDRPQRRDDRGGAGREERRSQSRLVAEELVALRDLTGVEKDERMAVQRGPED